MNPQTALHQVLSAIENTNFSTMNPSSTLALTLSRLGAPNQKIVAGTLLELSELPAAEFGEPLHAMVIVGKRLHPLEVEFAEVWAVSGKWASVAKESYGVKE